MKTVPGRLSLIASKEFKSVIIKKNAKGGRDCKDQLFIGFNITLPGYKQWYSVSNIQIDFSEGQKTGQLNWIVHIFSGEKNL